MAAETYYFFFSIILVVGALLYSASLIYFRAHGKTLIGNSYKPSTVEYRKLQNLSSAKQLVLAAVGVLIAIVNLAYDVNRILHLADSTYAHGILLYAPISCLVLVAILLVYARVKFLQP